MSALVDRLVAQVLGLEVRLLACQARLSARTDPEALHDLRTTVRRLRSLLRPLRGLPGVEQLEAAASGVGDLTTPLRDREVLAAYLLQHDQPRGRATAHGADGRGLSGRGGEPGACAVADDPRCLSAFFAGLPASGFAQGLASSASKNAWPSNGRNSIRPCTILPMTVIVCAC